MTDYCFALKNGFCEAMKEPRCPGYDVCPFYKKKSKNDEELLRYNGTVDVDRICLKRIRVNEAEIISLRQQGMTMRAIGERLGIPVSTVENICYRRGAGK